MTELFGKNYKWREIYQPTSLALSKTCWEEKIIRPHQQVHFLKNLLWFTICKMAVAKCIHETQKN